MGGKEEVKNYSNIFKNGFDPVDTGHRLFMIYLTLVSIKYFEVKFIMLVCLIFTDELAHKRKWFLPYKNQYINMQDKPTDWFL